MTTNVDWHRDSGLPFETEETLEAYEPTLREKHKYAIQDMLINKGVDSYDALQAAEKILGDPNSEGTILDGMGLADFSPLNILYGGQEGFREAQRGYNSGDPTRMALGVATAGLSAAEAFPLTKPLARGVGEALTSPTARRFYADEAGNFNVPRREVNPPAYLYDDPYDEPENVVEFYSPIIGAIEDMSIAKDGTKGSAIMATLNKRAPNIGRGQLEWANLNLDPDRLYTKEEVLAIAEESVPRVQLKSGTIQWADHQRQEVADDEIFYDELTLDLENNRTPLDTHHDENTLAHARVSGRQDPEGNNYLLVEELQSDALQGLNKKLDQTAFQEGVETTKTAFKDIGFRDEVGDLMAFWYQAPRDQWEDIAKDVSDLSGFDVPADPFQATRRMVMAFGPSDPIANNRLLEETFSPAYAKVRENIKPNYDIPIKGTTEYLVPMLRGMIRYAKKNQTDEIVVPPLTKILEPRYEDFGSTDAIRPGGAFYQTYSDGLKKALNVISQDTPINITTRPLEYDDGFIGNGLSIQLGDVEDIPSIMRFAEGGEVGDRETQEAFGDVEFEYSLKPILDRDPIARLGFDPSVARYMNTHDMRNAKYLKDFGDPQAAVDHLKEQYPVFTREYRKKYGEDPQPDTVLMTPFFGASPDVWVHEFRHRGYQKIRDAALNDPDGFVEKYGREAWENALRTQLLGDEEEHLVEMHDDPTAKFNLPDSGREVEMHRTITRSNPQASAAHVYDIPEMLQGKDREMSERSRVFEKIAEDLSDSINSAPGFKDGGKVGMDNQMKFAFMEGGDVDPVSGNEIPPGGTAEGVRDDVDAKVSKGEYIIPEYAVNFYGAEYFDKMVMKAQEELGHKEVRKPEPEMMEMAEGGAVPNHPNLTSNWGTTTPPQTNVNVPQAGGFQMEYYRTPDGQVRSIVVVNGQRLQQVPSNWERVDSPTPQPQRSQSTRTNVENISEAVGPKEDDSAKSDPNRMKPIETFTPEDYQNLIDQKDFTNVFSRGMSMAAPPIGMAMRSGYKDRVKRASAQLDSWAESGQAPEGWTMDDVKSAQNNMKQAFGDNTTEKPRTGILDGIRDAVSDFFGGRERPARDDLEATSSVSASTVTEPVTPEPEPQASAPNSQLAAYEDRSREEGLGAKKGGLVKRRKAKR